MERVTKEEVKKRIKEYNNLYFDGTLPSCEVSVAYFGFYGRFYHKTDNKGKNHNKIYIASNVDWTEETLKNIIIHEMVHFYTWVKYKYIGHGFLFYRECWRLRKRFGLTIRVCYTDIYMRGEKVPATRFGKFWILLLTRMFTI